MTFADVLLFAVSEGEHTQETNSGVGTVVLIAVILAIIVGAVVLFTIFHKAAKRSRGGVEPPAGEQHPGKPPFEGVARSDDPRTSH